MVFLPGRREKIDDQQDQEDGHWHAKQDTQQGLSNEVEAEPFEHEQHEVMDGHHTQGIAEKPSEAQLVDVGFFDVFKLLAAGDDADDGRPTEGHEGGGASMHSQGTHEEVDGQSDAETSEQQLPTPNIDREQHDEDEIDVRVHITAQPDMVDDEHLGDHQGDETDDIQHGPVHSFGWLLNSESSSALLV